MKHGAWTGKRCAHRWACLANARRLWVRTSHVSLQDGLAPKRPEVRYYATSLCPDRADTRRLQRIVRAYWEMENQLHHPKDRTWLEDRHWVKNMKTGSVLTILRSIACGLTRRARARGLNPKAHCPERIEFFNHSPRCAVALVKGGARL